MEFFEQLVEKVLHADGNFILQRKDGQAVLFIPIRFKTATFIYGIRSRKENFCIDTSNATDFRLAAVQCEDKLAIYDSYLVGKGYLTDTANIASTSTKLNILTWANFRNQISGKAKNKFFDPLFRDLEPDAPTKEIEERSMKQARRFLLQDDKPDFESWYPEVMSDSDAFLYLSDALNMEEHCMKVFDENKTKLSYLKAVKGRYEELISGDGSKAVQDWELKLSDALHSINGKNVIATFAVAGKRTTGRISIENILYAMSEKASIRPHHFITSKEGEKTYTDLGLKSYKDDLFCNNIAKVTFGKKEIFSR